MRSRFARLWEGQTVFPWDRAVEQFVQREQTFAFRPLQKAAINLCMAGFSCFLHFPTGYGKTMCFQTPALLAPPGKITVVISPLIALIQEQVHQLHSNGVVAAQLNSHRSAAEKLHVLTSLKSRQHRFQLLYVTPESIVRNRELVKVLEEMAIANLVNRFVFDEAHCILEWGNSFRPDYLEVCHTISRLAACIPITMISATASMEMMEDISRLFSRKVEVPDPELYMEMGDEKKTIMVPMQIMNDRPNLRIEVLPKDKKTMLTIANTVKNSKAIVYTLTQKEAENVAADLKSLGCTAAFYHSGLSDSKRSRIQHQWKSGKVSIICATVAFGMGIDQHDLNFVIHHSIPLSISSYYQQIGRAGRDGNDSRCILFFAPSDIDRARFISNSSGTSSSNDIDDVVRFCETATCRRNVLYDFLGWELIDFECNENCNCGLTDYSSADINFEEDYYIAKKTTVPSKKKLGSKSSMKIEIIYQKIIYKCKVDCNFSKKPSKSDILSRKVIQDILRFKPQTIEELAAMKGVGMKKAHQFFDVLLAEYCY